MLKFSTVLAFVIVIVSAFAVLFAEAIIPKSHQLTSSYTYRQYLADANKQAPADPVEYAKREQLFNAQLKEVMMHNAKPGQLYRKGLNHMSDWTAAEKKRLNGGKLSTNSRLKEQLGAKPYVGIHKAKASNQIFPKSLDWRNIGNVVTAVKDQGMCGSCWAHSSISTLESHYAIATGELFVLSQQQLTSCAPNPNQCGGTGGCGGSIAELAFQYAIENGGMTQEWEYPYTAYYGTTGECKIPTQATKIAKFSGYKRVTSNDQAAVIDALVNAGPLSVNVDASHWHNYEGGIYDGCPMSSNVTNATTSIDHVVVLNGYGFDFGLNAAYWIVRNSWSASFGEDGYIRLLKRDTPVCGWNIDAQDGTACYNQSSTQWVCGECGMLFDTSYPIPSL